MDPTPHNISKELSTDHGVVVNWESIGCELSLNADEMDTLRKKRDVEHKGMDIILREMFEIIKRKHPNDYLEKIQAALKSLDCISGLELLVKFGNGTGAKETDPKTETSRRQTPNFLMSETGNRLRAAKVLAANFQLTKNWEMLCVHLGLGDDETVQWKHEIGRISFQDLMDRILLAWSEPNGDQADVQGLCDILVGMKYKSTEEKLRKEFRI